MNIKNKLDECNLSEEITGHDIMDFRCFADHTRQMVILNVLTHNCPVGEKDELIRIFHNEEGYKKPLNLRNEAKWKSYCTPRPITGPSMTPQTVAVNGEGKDMKSCRNK